jgi:hypothetical protein
MDPLPAPTITPGGCLRLGGPDMERLSIGDLMTIWSEVPSAPMNVCLAGWPFAVTLCR